MLPIRNQSASHIFDPGLRIGGYYIPFDTLLFRREGLAVGAGAQRLYLKLWRCVRRSRRVEAGGHGDDNHFAADV